MENHYAAYVIGKVFNSNNFLEFVLWNRVLLLFDVNTTSRYLEKYGLFRDVINNGRMFRIRWKSDPGYNFQLFRMLTVPPYSECDVRSVSRVAIMAQKLILVEGDYKVIYNWVAYKFNVFDLVKWYVTSRSRDYTQMTLQSIKAYLQKSKDDLRLTLCHVDPTTFEYDITKIRSVRNYKGGWNNDVNYLVMCKKAHRRFIAAFLSKQHDELIICYHNEAPSRLRLRKLVYRLLGSNCCGLVVTTPNLFVSSIRTGLLGVNKEFHVRRNNNDVRGDFSDLHSIHLDSTGSSYYITSNLNFILVIENGVKYHNEWIRGIYE